MVDSLLATSFWQDISKCVLCETQTEKGQILKKLSRHQGAGTQTLYSPLNLKLKAYSSGTLLCFTIGNATSTIQ